MLPKEIEVSNSTNKSIADKEAAKTHHVDEPSHPGHQKRHSGHGPGARDERGRELEREVKRSAKKK
jgi:hypothetical protein